MHVDLFASEDEGRTWEYGGPLTLTRQHPPHLCRLNDGRILLTYGLRNPGVEGVGDGIYPSSVQVEDGTIVTAYCSAGIPAHRRYHMGVVRWGMEDISSKSWGFLHWRSAPSRD